MQEVLRAVKVPARTHGRLSSGAMTRARVATEWPWHRPIFPGLGDPSIVGAGAFHCRVRNGNGWDHSALATRTNRSPRERTKRA